MSIPAHTIEQVAAANDIVEVISSYFPLKRAGSSFRALCPFHQEKTPSFHVNPARQSFHCFGCGAGGSVFRFVMDYEHVDFPTAVRRLAARAGIPVIEEVVANAAEDRQHQARRTLLRLHAEAAEWFHDNLMKRQVGQPAREYLKKRGLTNEVARSWQLGFAPDSWDAFSTFAREQGFAQRDLVASGLVSTRETETAQMPNAVPDRETSMSDASNSGAKRFYDRFRGRLMFPICNDIGEVIGFSGRILTEEVKIAKYLNSPETPLFRKGSILFGLHKTKRGLIEARSAIVCEGQLDLITLYETGLTNVVAPQGTAFTEAQARILKRYVDEVVLCFDADTAGMKAAERSLNPLLQNDLVVRVAEMPAGEDPDSLVRREGVESFRERILAARDFFDFWIERESVETDLTNLSAKLQLARSLAETISKVQDPIMRAEVINKATARLGLAAADFARLLPKDVARREQVSLGKRTASAPSHEIALLCLLALRSPEAREFLLKQDWQEVLKDTPDTALLEKILVSNLEPEDSVSLNFFMTTLPPEEESLVSRWLSQKMPPNPEIVAREWWQGLRQPLLRRRLQAAESRLKLPQISPGEVVALQKQVVDLRQQLDQFFRFSPTHAPN